MDASYHGRWDFAILFTPQTLQLRLHPLVEGGNGSAWQSERVSGAIASLEAQLRLAVVSRNFHDVDDVAVCNLADRESCTTGCDDEIGIQAVKLSQQQNQPEDVCERGNDKLHENARRIGWTSVINAANENGRVGGN